MKTDENVVELNTQTFIIRLGQTFDISGSETTARNSSRTSVRGRSAQDGTAV